MFGSIGMGEMIVIFIIALIIFGPRKLPELGRALGKGINEFKKASNDLRTTIEDEINADARRTAEQPGTLASAVEPTEPKILPPAEPPQPAGGTPGPASHEPEATRTEHGA